MNIMPATIEEPGLDTQRAGTLEAPPSAAPSICMIAPIYWAMELVSAVAKDRASRGLKRWQPEEGVQGAVGFLGSIASVGNVGQISYSSTKAGLEGTASTLMAESMY